jgi:uncharacterized protein (DUF983 family)
VKLRGFLRSRCPRCLQGRVFVPGIPGLVGAINEACQACGLRFLRESGYFLGAMYISYGLGMLTILPSAVILAVVLEWPLAIVLTISLLQTVISVPLFLRYSRLIWLYMDQSIDPR